MKKGIATFAGGCFSCLAAAYGQLRSIRSVASGHVRAQMPSLMQEDVYGGGTGDAEVVQITFDPNEISYADLLEIFFAIHDPTTLGRPGDDVDSRHRSAIFFHSPEQAHAARETVAKLQPSFRGPIVTQIVASGPFRKARDFDQTYCEQHDQARCGAPRHRVAAAISDLFARQAAEMIERRRAVEALERTEFYLSEGQRISHTGSWSCKPGGEEVFWSDEHFRIWGLAPSASHRPDHTTFVASLHAADRSRALEAFAGAVAEGRAYDCEYRMQRPDGSVRNIHSIAHPAFDAAGHLLEYAGTVVDVTDQRRAEEEARRAAACLTQSERMAHAGSWSMNVRTGALVWSEEHYRIFGLPPGAPITREQAAAMIHPDDRDAACETWLRAIAGAQAYELQMRVVRPDGAVRRVRSIGHPVVDDAGAVEEFIGTLIDETERRDTEEALARTRGELAHVARVMTMGQLGTSSAHEPSRLLPAIPPDEQACIDIEVLIPCGRGARESIHIPLQDGALPSGGTVGTIADEIARQIFEKLPRRRDAPGAAPSLAPQRLRRVLAHIEEHLGERVTVRQLAAVAHMSVFHFARMFKRSVSTPPHAYVTRRRIERAKDLLARSELPLVEVAARAGFQTQAHFTVVFHRHVGLPPRAFRLRAQAPIDAR